MIVKDGKMKIKKFEHTTNASGTSLKGYITTTYDELVERFGEPTDTQGDKTTASWCLEFEVENDDGDTDYITATIYDWKTDTTPLGEYRWHIGGFDYLAEDCVYQTLKEGQGQLFN